MYCDRAERISFAARVLLEFKNGVCFIGITNDISETGVFVDIGYPPFQVDLEDPGFLHMMPAGSGQPMVCRVKRITGDGIAVQFLPGSPVGLTTKLSMGRRRCVGHGNASLGMVSGGNP
ncbi:MAG: PilZ domain-containing protein [Magnetococcales bacterium]|nr:PilZ domain-containing protein [Magnetococcales bacterium]